MPHTANYDPFDDWLDEQNELVIYNSRGNRLPSIDWDEVPPDTTHALWTENRECWYFWKVANGKTRYFSGTDWVEHRNQRAAYDKLHRNFPYANQVVVEFPKVKPKTPKAKQSKRRTGMNLRTVALICHEGITSVGAYPITAGGGREPGNYTFACPVVIAEQLTEGDLVVVETSCYGYRLFKVDEIHTDPRFDPNTDIEYQFVISRIDRSIVDNLESEVKVAEENLRVHQTRGIRQQILGQFGISNPSELFKGLPAADEKEE